ncbi:hypothetical protein BP5796_09686 [Coleophoma crateriformis]|uniref:Response regulatory domain-containing protein n=1 Tax=Coleophoma crateriformis TaxID=565419 RepID=A0A3D8QYT7_9HELO|nr:hypothetical protein BP5796_09686 [Coleophoma crateriformis]
MAIVGDIKSKLRAKFSRRESTHSAASSAEGADGVDAGQDAKSFKSFRSKITARSGLSRRGSHASPLPFGSSATALQESNAAETEHEKDDEKDQPVRHIPGAFIDVDADGHVDANVGACKLKPQPEPANREVGGLSFDGQSDLQQRAPLPLPSPSPSKLLDVQLGDNKHDSTSTANFLPTPNSDFAPVLDDTRKAEDAQNHDPTLEVLPATPTSSIPLAIAPKKPELSRRQSLIPSQQTRLIKTLLETDIPSQEKAATFDYFQHNGPSTISANMVSRKIWVKRPNASATLVQIHEDDLVDDVREMILKKYANSLGKNFDAPDVTLRIIPREHRQERTLGPEEPMGRTLDAYFVGGQTVDEALVIDVPLRRTPRPSPRPNVHNVYYDESRPLEGGSDYFPPMPVPAIPSPHLPHSLPVTTNGHASNIPHAMSVLSTGHVPALPSPNAPRRHPRERPRLPRQHTSSPTVIGGHTPTTVISNGTQPYTRVTRSRTHSSASEKSANGPPPPPPLVPTPPIQDMTAAAQIARVATPPPARVSSPRPDKRTKKKKAPVEHPSLPAGMLNGGVPPINVLIVEDNIINLKLLEAFMKRLKVRWQTAMNGKEAVTKWRAGGFHLVLMDIQLPIMNGLEATKEIRRLERLNSIGVFSSSASSSAPERDEGDEPQGEDLLPSTVLFKSPVIIVALTASSLQSDRHEALAAGCNDFLTKPVNFVWLERKVMEWGCMQALIDFDGWRKWKDFSQAKDESTLAENKKKDKTGEVDKKKRKKNNRSSLGSIGGAAAAKSIKEENEELAAAA